MPTEEIEKGHSQGQRWQRYQSANYGYSTP